MKFNYLKVTMQDSIALVTISRPPVNALNLSLLKELDQLIDALEADKEVDLLILVGEGKAFVAGADIEEMAKKTALEATSFAAYGASVFRKLEVLSKPVIAAVNGFALGGGCELIMACDIRIASEKAKLGQPEVALGITPGFAGSQRLPRLVGPAKAKELILTGDPVTAQEALEIGLVNQVVSADNLVEASMAMAKRILKNSQLAVRAAKAAINEGVDLDFESASHIEKLYFGLCFSTEDQKEGMKAFLERRKPIFKNR